MKTLKNYLILFALLALLGCGNKTQDEKVTSDQSFGEQKSTHESEWEQHSDQNVNNIESCKLQS